jgi:propionyl-CoA synthetase
VGHRDEHTRSLADPVAFWREQARGIDWFRPPDTIVDRGAHGMPRWFPDGVLNTAWLALDRHVAAGRGEQPALIHDSPVTGSVRSWTFAELRDAVALFAGALRGLGVQRGDRVIVYMPMVPEAVIAMLACARIGAVHSVVFGGFAAPELALRIDDATPKVVVSASCGIEFQAVIPYKPLLDAALAQARHAPAACVILQRPQCTAALLPGRDHDWQALLGQATPAAWVELASTDPLYILYTSGTTGKPKGILRDNGGHAVALRYSMQAVYDMRPGQVFWAASDVGWVVGHSYIVYGPLLHGCTSVLYEGKPVRTPDAGAFWRVIEQHRVRTCFAAPTAFRAIRKEDPGAALKAGRDLSSLAYLFVAGERLDPPTGQWLHDVLGVPVIDHWWQTESGWPMCANMPGVELLPTRPGSPTLPVPGYDLRVLDDDGRELGPMREGNVVIRTPLPPGAASTIWGDHARYADAYLARFPGYYLTGDGGYRDADGYVFIMGRVDDVINVAGHRLSTGEMEQVVAGHPAVAECAVIGIEDADRGQVPLGLVVLKDGVNVDAARLQSELVASVRAAIGAFANFRRVAVVRRLPKTRSGKILRAVLRRIADGRPYTMPSTIDDPAILDEIAPVLVAARRP